MSVAVTPVPKQQPKTLLAVLVRRRITLSIFLFGGLVVVGLVRGLRPHAPLNWRDSYSLAGLLAVLLGVAIRTWAAGTLTKSTQLTTTGPYRIVRNPLYLGSFLMLAGFCLLLGDHWILAAAVLPTAGLYYLKIRAEEKFLGDRFGDAWTVFATQTPRLVPRRVPRGDGSWRLAQWLDNREYQALLAALAGLAALQCWIVWSSQS